jgi:phosphonoacetate hydrolase
MYLSTTDYVQHKFPPGSPPANDFYAMLDTYMAKLEELGCVIAVTADHGMHAKTCMNGNPRVIYLADWLSQNMRREDARVILPITDPYIAHHGALGSFATIYLPPDVPAQGVCTALATVEGIDCTLTRDQAASELELPADRIGDLVVLADRFTVLGTTAADHDLSGLDVPLRSHGGRGEQKVPLILNRSAPLLDRSHKWHNYDAFYLALNYAQWSNP